MWVLQAQLLFSNGQSLQVKREGLLWLYSHLVEASKIMQTFCRFEMLLSSLAFPNGECMLVERMVGGEIALPTANSELYVTVTRYTAPQSMVIWY